MTPKLLSDLQTVQIRDAYQLCSPTVLIRPNICFMMLKRKGRDEAHIDDRYRLVLTDIVQQRLLDIKPIEHDLDMVRNADYIIDMGPGGGEDGGRIIVCGRPEEVKQCKDSITTRFL